MQDTAKNQIKSLISQAQSQRDPVPFSSYRQQMQPSGVLQKSDRVLEQALKLDKEGSRLNKENHRSQSRGGATKAKKGLKVKAMKENLGGPVN